jgi:hypothetical protein
VSGPSTTPLLPRSSSNLSTKDAGEAGAAPALTSVSTGVPYVDVDAAAGPVVLGVETLVHDRPHRLFVYATQPSFVMTLSLRQYQRLLTIAPSVPHGSWQSVHTWDCVRE